jgi:preprotein translocase subunit SecE
MNPLEPIKQSASSATQFVGECWSELKKVYFPTRKETQAATMVVLVGVVIVATYLGIIDLLLAKAVERIFK